MAVPELTQENEKLTLSHRNFMMMQCTEHGSRICTRKLRLVGGTLSITRHIHNRTHKLRIQPSIHKI
ncbi:hypothetical protein P692DRAFT_20841615 [Suillus brevipes Sb2]|nr:hypothetical protein P692DRAFT_20841615 [Suillus brevipes Sb2]